MNDNMPTKKDRPSLGGNQDEKKISVKYDDLPSVKHMNEQIQGMKMLMGINKFLRFFGMGSKRIAELDNNLQDISKEFEERGNYIKKFNEYFSNEGWIVYDSMNSEAIHKAVDIHEREGHEKSIEFLHQHYAPSNIEWQVKRFKFTKEFEHRSRFIELAYEDYKSERYYSTIPILLMTIDGVINDTIHKGFHASSIKLDAWDSITNAEDGIDTIKDIFQTSRTKTTVEVINKPFRHGILHGRDLGYDNYSVAAKAWCFLFVIRDWIQSKKSENERKDKFKKDTTPPSWKELIAQISKNEEVKEKLNSWKPRVINKDFIKSLRDKEPDETTPEYMLIQYLSAWKACNYGKMAMNTSLMWGKNQGKLAGELREQYGNCKLNQFEIIDISDEASGLTEVKILAKLNENTNEIRTLRLICEDNNGDVTPRNVVGGKWKIVTNNTFNDEKEMENEEKME